MNFEDLIYDIKTILSKSSITDDTRLDDMFIAHKCNNYRSIYIKNIYYKTRQIDHTWLQDLGKLDVTCVSSGDDPNLYNTSIKLGKITLPPIVSLPDDIGVWNIRSSSKQKKYFPIDISMFYLMINVDDIRLRQFDFYYKIGDAIYIYPFEQEISGQFILDNPLDGYVLLTEKVKNDGLEDGQVYKVYKGQITYAGTVYSPDDTFTCSAINGFTYSGSGYVMYNTQKRNINIKDRYPCDRALAQSIVLDILTKDYQIEQSKVSDIVNDSEDQFKVLSKNG